MLLQSHAPSLKASSIVEILRRTLQIYSQHFMIFLGLALIIQIPFTIINTLIGISQRSVFDQSSLVANLNPTSITPEQAQALLGPIFGALVVVALVTLVASFLQTIFIASTITVITADTELGRFPSLGLAVQVVSKRFADLITGIGIYYALMVILIVGLTFAFFLCGLGFGIILYLGLTLGALLVPALLLEQGSSLKTLQRVWQLGRARIWSIVGVTFATYAVLFVINFLLSTLAGGLLVHASPASSDWLGALIDFIPAVLFVPVLPIAYTLVYFDARVRIEKLDEAFLLNPETDLAAVVPPLLARPFGNDDVLNVALITMGTFVLLLVLFGFIFFTSSLGAPALMGQYFG